MSIPIGAAPKMKCPNCNGPSDGEGSWCHDCLKRAKVSFMTERINPDLLHSIYIDAGWPLRCQGCVPRVNCLWVTGDENTEIDVCPRGAQLIAVDVMDAADYLCDCVNLNDRAVIEAVLRFAPLDDFVDRAIWGGRLDNFIDRAIKCIRRARPVSP
jgi:hypothetical protein